MFHVSSTVDSISISRCRKSSGLAGLVLVRDEPLRPGNVVLYVVELGSPLKACLEHALDSYSTSQLEVGKLGYYD